MDGGELSGVARSHRPRRPVRSAACALVCVLVACVGVWSPPEPTGYHRTAPVEGAGERIGAEHCYDCHDSFEGHFVASAQHPDCESCHGAGQLHAYTAGAADVRYPSNRDCAACHQIGSRTLLGWTSSVHARSDVTCTDCHDVHNRELWNLREPDALQTATLPNSSATSRLCLSCHPEVRAQLDLPSHHPIGEGMMDCTDCHGAHESRRSSLGDRTRRCTVCHQEVAGPWVYQHPPVTEDCGFCHAPHGASADFLLETSQPAACISCHTLPIAGAVHQPFAFTTACTDCHGSVHGSYADPHLRR